MSTPELTSTKGCPCDGCDIPVDVIFLSSDGEDIGGHSSALEAFSEAFPPLGMVETTGDPIPLTESGATLRRLFHFTHKRPYDQVLDESPLYSLLELAEAAQKYLIYHAMEICRLHVKMRWKEDPLRVVVFSAKHSYIELVDVAAPSTLRLSLSSIEKAADENKGVVFAWLRYYHAWMEVAEFALTKPHPYINSKRRAHECPGSSIYFKETLAELPRTTHETIASLPVA